MRSISLFFLCMIPLLSGCPSAFYAKTQINPQSTENIAAIKNPATVSIERDDNVWGGAIPVVIHDGNKEIGQLGPSGAFEWKREAGYLHLRMSETTGKVGAIVGQGHPEDIFYEDFQKPGDTHRFICGIKVDNDVTIRIEPQQEQAPEDIVAFGKAVYSNTIGSYEGFITSHAKSPNIDEAIRRYENLIEEAGILDIDNLNKKNVEILKAYLKALPNGKHSQFAEDVNQYYEAERKPSKKAFDDYLEKWPDGKFEKWAKENLASVSLGEVKNPSLIKTQEAACRIARSGFKEILQSLSKDISDTNRTLQSTRGFQQLNKMEILEDVVVLFKGTLGYSIDATSKPSLYYNGEVSKGLSSDGFTRKFILQFDVLTDPNIHINTSTSGLLEGSWISMDGKKYLYNGSHWVHGLDNSFFPVDE